MSVHEHKKKKVNVNCLIITISDTRTTATDKSGNLMEQLLIEEGHKVMMREIVTDDKESIEAAIDKGCKQQDVDVILTNGGTGIAKRDVTIETVTPMFDKEIVGFGELFRMLSYTEDIGSAAMMSRAVAGIRNNKAIFSTPGSSGAVKLAMNKLILPELSHVITQLKKDIEAEKN